MSETIRTPLPTDEIMLHHNCKEIEQLQICDCKKNIIIRKEANEIEVTARSYEKLKKRYQSCA